MIEMIEMKRGRCTVYSQSVHCMSVGPITHTASRCECDDVCQKWVSCTASVAPRWCAQLDRYPGKGPLAIRSKRNCGRLQASAWFRYVHVLGPAEDFNSYHLSNLEGKFRLKAEAIANCHVDQEILSRNSQNHVSVSPLRVWDVWDPLYWMHIVWVCIKHGYRMVSMAIRNLIDLIQYQGLISIGWRNG